MAITKTPPRRYRIFPSYIDSQGKTVHSGEYHEYEIDINEARQRSTAVLINASEFQELKPEPVATDNPITNTGDVIFQNVTTVAKINKLKINSASIDEISNLKFVGKVSAQKIIEARKDVKIESYKQLDRIAPIKGNKTWQDIAVIDFELPDPTYGLIYEGLQTFGYNAENIDPNDTSKSVTSE